ncbi:hypothetical protein TRFO_11659 [Tritrichomonas foetus]|uniref:Uncharacterized protein n=1 Tax=Tritrichomonas foetus TaxID=1144522 RepID=A0A1J4J4L8_9EUKA|nr:hypothetical protein TRFO_11659 [Tritrichomonas foetus]|eukprot:OHS93657.1 hypothetical protein TRFO_11659 [Tritrichomonas foetus]
MNVTCFDVSDNIQVFGTEFGCIHLINNVDGNVKSTFLVEENAKVCDVRVLSNNILYWSTTKYYGGIDISSNKVFTYENRSGSAIAVAYSEDIIVIQRDKFVVCVNDVKNLISKSRKPILSEKPFSFPIEIISICVQQKSTSSTISKFGDKPVFAVLLKNNQIHFFNIHSKEPIIRLRCPEDLPRPVSIAWKQSVFVTADWNGKFIFYDFEYGSSRLEAAPFGNIKRVDFDKSENGLFIHSSVENKLGFFTDKVSVCKTQVSDFSTTDNGLVTVKTPFQTIVVLLLRDWSPLIKVASQSVVKPLDNYENRIIHIIDKIQNINQKENLNENTDMTNSDDLRKNDEFESVRNKISLGIENLEDQGLVFETKLLMVIQRYLYEYQKYKKSLDQITSSQEKYDDFKRSLSSSNFNSSIALKNQPKQNSPNRNECKTEKDNSIFLLPLKMANFAAGSSELHLCNQFKAELIRGCSDVHSALYAALLNLQINDIEGARECLLSVASSGIVNEFFPICALAASLLGSSIDKTAIGVLKGSSITLFDANDVQSALFLLTVGQMETFAVKILQERELWEESIILLSHLRDILFSDENICLSLTKLSSNASIQQLSSQQNLDLNEMNHINNKKSQEINLYESLNINLSESELKDLNNSVLNYKSHPEEIKDMIRQAAHNYLDHGDFEKSILLFASLGDFLPVISIALAQKNYCLAYLLFIILESSGLINEYDKDTRFFNIQFDSPSFIERQVKNKYSKLISEKT